MAVRKTAAKKVAKKKVTAPAAASRVKAITVKQTKSAKYLAPSATWSKPT